MFYSTIPVQCDKVQNHLIINCTMFSKVIYAVLVCCFFLIIRTYTHCDSLDKYSIKNKFMWINLYLVSCKLYDLTHTLFFQYVPGAGYAPTYSQTI
jgi:hypothetical protein